VIGAGEIAFAIGTAGMMAMNENGLSLGIGALVRFAHERNGGPVHRVVALASDGMVELHDMGGWFAQHHFAVADDIGGIQEKPVHLLDGLLEPGARDYDAVVSIAISLKRLADHLAPTDGKLPPLLWLGDMIRSPQS
jgi:hypothetical protein